MKTKRVYANIHNNNARKCLEQQKKFYTNEDIIAKLKQ